MRIEARNGRAASPLAWFVALTMLIFVTAACGGTGKQENAEDAPPAGAPANDQGENQAEDQGADEGDDGADEQSDDGGDS